MSTLPTALPTALPTTLPTTSTASNEHTIITKQEFKFTRLTTKYDPKGIQGTISMDYGERGSHARSTWSAVHLEHDNGKSEASARNRYKNNSERAARNMEGRHRWALIAGKRSQTRPNYRPGLDYRVPEERDSSTIGQQPPS